MRLFHDRQKRLEREVRLNQKKRRLAGDEDGRDVGHLTTIPQIYLFVFRFLYFMLFCRVFLLLTNIARMAGRRKGSRVGEEVWQKSRAARQEEMEAGSEKTWIEVREEQRRWEEEGWQWNKNDRKEKSGRRRRRVGIKQIGWRWAEWKWREGRNERRGGGEGGRKRGGSHWLSVGAVWMLIRRFCRFTLCMLK